jgi:signal transduction histidine kinase/ActR/RegA family two-component response regulator
MKTHDSQIEEAARLERLRRLRLMDTAGEAVLDGFTEMAAAICGLPISLVSLVDDRRQWFKSAVGIPQGLETPRELAFCAHAIQQSDLFEVSDARVDERFRSNPLVTGSPHVVHYAGVPLVMPEGERIGTLCVINHSPGRLSDSQRECLSRLAKNVVNVLLLREQQLNLEDERLLAGRAHLAHLVPTGVFWTDGEGAVIGCNDQFLRLIGRSYLEVVGKPWDAYGSSQDRSWRAALHEGVLCEGTLELQHPEKLGRRWLKFQLLPSTEVGAPCVRLYGAVIDVTREHETVQALSAREAQLKDALREADEANRAKSDFLATMSHEIRTPINGVIGLTNLLGHLSLPARANTYVTGIDSCARSLLGLVDNILDLSKIEACHLSLEIIDVELRGFLDELAQSFQVRAQAQEIAFVLRVDSKVPRFIRADPTRLRQIVANLLSNAIKFTHAGEISISVNVDELSATNEKMLVIAVADSGIGIPADAQARIFRRYTQADASTTRKYRGTGLGLAISGQLAALMGGSIGLESELGRGSTFTLRIPLVRGETTECTDAQLPNSGAKADFVGKRILLVEDNDINQMVCVGLLTSMGVTESDVTVAENGVAALAFHHPGNRYDLILMDCQMPEMDGFTATRHLRAQGVDTPIVALTANAMMGDRDRCVAAGMTDYLTKPIEPSKLAETLNRYLRRPDAREGSWSVMTAQATVHR